MPDSGDSGPRAPVGDGRSRTPRLLLAAALSLCVALLGMMSWQAVSGYRAAEQLSEQGPAAERLAGQIIQLDEVLTGTALLAAATGDPMLESRYRANVLKLDAVMAEMRRVGEGDPIGGSPSAAISRTDADLVGLEQKAFDLIRDGRSAAALALLRGPEYEASKNEYSRGVRGFVASVRAGADRRLASEQRSAIIWIAVAMASLVLTGVLAALLQRSLRRWSAGLDAADASRDRAADARGARRFDELSRSSSDVTTVLAADGSITYHSPSARTVFGHDPEVAVGTHFVDLVHPDDRDKLRFLLEAARSSDGVCGEIRLCSSEGTWRVADTTLRDLGDDPAVGGIVINSHDVTGRVAARRQAQDALAVERARAAELAQTESLLKHVVRNAPLVFYALDREGTFTLSMGKALEELGLSEGEIVGTSAWDVYADHTDILGHLRAAYDGDTVTTRVEVGDTVFQSAYVPVLDGESVTGVVGVATDVTGQARLERELRHRAEHDALTGLPNRTTFHQQVGHSLRFDAMGTCLVLIDVDGFKEVNDTRGHEAGDRVLATIGDRLRTAVRGEDLVARLGGDEFGALVRTTDPVIADKLTVRLLEAVAEPIADVSGPIRLTASAGVVGPGLGHDGIEQAMRDADLAMYDAKRTSGSRFSRFDPAMREEFMERIRLKDELALALTGDDLVLEYQPLIDVVSGRVVGVEALVRWDHPTRGRLGPGAFLPAAEESGQIAAIDTFALREATRQVAAWRRSDDLAMADVDVSVNISASDFSQVDLVKLVSDTLADNDLDPAALVVELTETAAMENVDATVATLRDLARVGVRVALDDFGTGYSSLSQLQRLDFDILKVDRSFAADGTDAAATSLAETIVGLGRLLGLSVVAEGIETAGQLDAMSRAGCDVVQGYFFARPMDAEHCAAFIGERHAEGATALTEPGGDAPG